MKTMRKLAVAMLSLVVCGGTASAQSSQEQAPAAPPASAPLTALVDQLMELFPRIEGDLVEVRDGTITLDVGVRNGARPGLIVELFREGREIKHPRTGQVLGHAEESLGSTKITAVQDAFSAATIPAGSAVKPGDHFRVSSGKINLVLLPLLGGVRESLVEAATQELVESLGATGRFRVTMGDAINVYLAQQGIRAEDFLAGKGVREALGHFKHDNVLALYFKRVQNKAFMDVKFFALPGPDPMITAAFFVPRSTIRAASQTARFSRGGPANPPQAKPRSLLARLLGGDLEAGSYSSGESSIPLREVAKFKFPVLAMDIAVSPKDKVPRMAVSDGDYVYMYRIVGQRVEPEWSKSVRSLGRVFSLQLADVHGDGDLEVIGNRFNPNTELNSFILGLVDGKPRHLVENIREFVFAVDQGTDGVKRTLWTQRYSPTEFFTPGQADQVVVKDGELVVEKPVRVAHAFRPMGAAFSNISGKDTRALAFINEFNRLQIVTHGEELWRSATSVGGGYMKVEQIIHGDYRGGRSKFYTIEPTPLAVDLDGDGIEELVVPQNLVREGLLAVVFKGPAGYRLQSVNSGFEGGITCLGAFKTEDAFQPTVIASVVRFSNFLKTSGETQIIMTIPQE
ncbi:MAG: hypothetical protein ACREK9_06440 [Candidatus Rokuibacteriota bacterium]